MLSWDRLHDLLDGLRTADVLDVLVVSLLVYLGITRFRRARSRFVMVGFVALVVLYAAAHLLGMYLTLSIFQAGVTVALVALVVIFQEDLRRAFERIGTAGSLGGSSRPSRTTELVQTLVRTATKLAGSRTGALVVVRGKEPLERHLTGGCELAGLPSEALLLSIFDASSPGHDGAVVIEAGVIKRFAAHLPLSTRIKDGARLGTRHTAALGLSERSDAFVIVVSEERGTLSVARAGVLDVVTAEQLEDRLTAFLERLNPAERRGWLRRALMENWGAKLGAMLVAAAAWLVFVGSESSTEARTFAVPIVYENVPAGLWLDAPDTLEARVTLSGTSRAFRLLDPAQLTISLDTTRIKPGAQKVPIEDRALRRPTGFLVHRIEPASVTLVAHRAVPVEFKVRPELVGKLRRGLELVEVKSEPSEITGWVRQEDRGRITTIATEDILLSEIEGSTTLVRALELPKGAQLADGSPARVRISLEVRAR
jgi:uncharacterized protein (TIGR00159 family)